MWNDPLCLAPIAASVLGLPVALLLRVVLPRAARIVGMGLP